TLYCSRAGSPAEDSMPSISNKCLVNANHVRTVLDRIDLGSVQSICQRTGFARSFVTSLLDGGPVDRQTLIEFSKAIRVDVEELILGPPPTPSQIRRHRGELVQILSARLASKILSLRIGLDPANPPTGKPRRLWIKSAVFALHLVDDSIGLSTHDFDPET